VYARGHGAENGKVYCNDSVQGYRLSCTMLDPYSTVIEVECVCDPLAPGE
jgi:hypothetical protein